MPPTMLLRILAALVLMVVAGVATPAWVACACSCAALDTDQAMRNASAVFDGTVKATSRPTTGLSAEQIEYTIAVSRVYQGSVPAEVVVRSYASSSSCGAELTGQVTVFAQGPTDSLRTNLCSAPATIDRSLLGAGQPPTSAPPMPEPLTTTYFGDGPLIMGILAGLLVPTGIAIWIVRRARQ
ncbi:MAG: hypothetical protein WAS07_15080 [Micropruina sp.]|nr:hypothetical protein [Micropruina sp.]